MTTTVEEKMDLARKGAALLYANGASKVWVFGSVAKGRRQDGRSDLDLAVEGLPDDVHFGVLGELLDLFPCSVDLVQMEKASRENIVRNRVLLPREN